MRRILSAICVAVVVGCASCSTPPAEHSSTLPSSSAQSTAGSSSPTAQPSPASPAGEKSLAECQSGPAGEEFVRCVEQIPAEQLAGSLLAVGVTDFDTAQQAVDHGVRHLFFGTGSDFSMLNGQGDPQRSVAELERRAGGPLVVSVDEEGGLVQRLSSIVGTLPSAREMAATRTPDQVRGMMRAHGEKMRALGITMDFAPVVDLGTAGSVDDNAIGSRSFSDDPQVAADYGRAYAQGLLDAGVAPVIKHFPGHGHVTGDSHKGAVTAPPLDELKRADLVPFQQLATMDGMAVMVGHMHTPGIDSGQTFGANTPASLNPGVYQLLRGSEVKARGAVFTDDLSGMQAITDRYSGEEAAARAIQAGADQALVASGAVDVPRAVEAVRAYIREGKITLDHVHAAVLRAHQKK